MTHRPTVYGTRHAVSAGHYLPLGRLLDPGGRRQRDRRGCRGRDRARRAAARSGQCRRCRADPDPPGRRHGREHRRARLVAEEPPRRPVHARARRQDPRRRAAHRGARGARCLDHRAAPPRHDALRRCRRVGDPFRRRGIRGVSAAGEARSPRTKHEYRRWQSKPRSSCPTAACPKPGEKFVQSDLARTLQYMADQDRAAGRTGGRPAMRRTRVLSRRHRPRDRSLSATGRRLPVDGRPRRIPFGDRARRAPALAWA